MYREVSKEVMRFKRLSGELTPFSFRRIERLNGWTIEDRRIELPFSCSGKFGIFRCTLPATTVSDGSRVKLKLDIDGSALVRVDGDAIGEIDEYHKEVDISRFSDGIEHDIEVEVVPMGSFGESRTGDFRDALIVEKDVFLNHVILYLKNLVDLLEISEDDLATNLIEILDAFFSRLKIPRSSDVYSRVVVFDPSISGEVERFGFHINPIDLSHHVDSLKKSVSEAFEDLRRSVSKLVEIFPKTGRVVLAGHSHIDYAWLWNVDETKRKILRTLSNVISLMDVFGRFVFIQSSAKIYEDVKDLDDSLYKRIVEKIREGRWEPVGGMWLESDTNLPPLEAVIRQFVHGQGFFEKEFGFRSKVCWLPDVFGFPWTLPQVLRGVGIDLFITTKLTWNESNEFPYDLCVWRGIDGSEVVYYSFKNDEGGYNGLVNPKGVSSVWKNFKQKGKLGEVFATFGYGDGGGGPTEDMVESIDILNEFPDMPRVSTSRLEDFREKVLKVENLPTWDGELYLELHRGTYTSQSRLKKLHDDLYEILRTAEILNVYTERDFQKDLDGIWKILLESEFHDVLPGSSIAEVYKYYEEKLSCAIYETRNIITSMLREGKESLFNPSSFASGGIPPLGVSDPKDSGGETLEDLENEFVKVSFEEDGSFNIYSKEHGRWVFSEPARLSLHPNVPYYWDNWEIDVNHNFYEIPLEGRIVERGNPTRVLYSFEGSKVNLSYFLEPGSKVLEVNARIDWHTRRSVLKATFPVNVLARKALFDLDGGYIERNTTRNTNFEKARFEVPFQRWVSVSERNFGVSVLTHSKHGCSVEGSKIGLTLIKAGIFPDFFSEEGFHEFRYGILVHSGDVVEIVEESESFVRRPVLLKGYVPRKNLETFGTLKVLSMRSLENGRFSVRLIEYAGGRGKGVLNFKGFGKIKDVFFTNLLDDPIEKIDSAGSSIEFDYEPFKIYTFSVKVM